MSSQIHYSYEDLKLEVKQFDHSKIFVVSITPLNITYFKNGVESI